MEVVGYCGRLRAFIVHIAGIVSNPWCIGSEQLSVCHCTARNACILCDSVGRQLMVRQRRDEQLRGTIDIQSPLPIGTSLPPSNLNLDSSHGSLQLVRVETKRLLWEMPSLHQHFQEWPELWPMRWRRDSYRPGAITWVGLIPLHLHSHHMFGGGKGNVIIRSLIHFGFWTAFSGWSDPVLMTSANHIVYTHWIVTCSRTSCWRLLNYRNVLTEIEDT